jgi:hypothetical protein
MSKLPQIYFYIPQRQWVSKLPQRIEDYWEWVCQPGIGKYKGSYTWTLETYLYLKGKGFPCQIIGTLPKEGIVLSHYDCLEFDSKPSPRLLIVCCKAERKRHPYAQIHIVQNPYDPMIIESDPLWPAYYIPGWPQPGLISRNPERGEKFENIACFGYELAPELKESSWQKKLETLGFHTYISDVDKCNSWNDYSFVDVTVNVRSFNETSFNEKPSHKLYNAWLAGVPAILGRESAFRAERESDLDYIEVNSQEEIIEALKLLRDNKELRRKMVENGKIRIQKVIPTIVKEWEDFLINVAIPAYRNYWSKKSGLSKTMNMTQYWFSALSKLSKRIYRKIKNMF